jgi:hypothetical protein
LGPDGGRSSTTCGGGARTRTLGPSTHQRNGVALSHRLTLIGDPADERPRQGQAQLDPSRMGTDLTDHAVSAEDTALTDPVMMETSPRRRDDQALGQRRGFTLEIRTVCRSPRHRRKGMWA